MNLITTAFVSYLSIASVESLGLRRATVKTGDADAAATNAADAIIGEQRNLQVVPWCWVDGVEPAKKWHPVYAAGWDAGHCEENSDCNAPAYDSELDCCKHVYLNQESGACLGSLPNPPTKTPTSTPTGNPVVAPTPPTPPAPTPTDGKAGFWYPDYETSDWSMGVCKNDWPLPYENESDRPNYPTQLQCCQAAYGGQMSGACLGSLPNPPTKTPTSAPTGSPVVTPPSPTPPTDGTAGFWYPDYATNWFDAGCLNTWPLVGFNENDRPKFGTQLECCNQAYSGQTSMACIGMIPST